MQTEPSDLTTQEIYQLIGMVVLLLQTTERVLRACIAALVSDDEISLYENWMRFDENEAKGTLGFHLRKLSLNAEVREVVEEVLKEFLEKRNNLIHDVRNIDGWNLKSVEGRGAAFVWLRRFAALNTTITRLLLGLMESRHGISPPTTKDEFDREIAEEWAPLAKILLQDDQGEN